MRFGVVDLRLTECDTPRAPEVIPRPRALGREVERHAVDVERAWQRRAAGRRRPRAVVGIAGRAIGRAEVARGRIRTRVTGGEEHALPLRAHLQECLAERVGVVRVLEADVRERLDDRLRLAPARRDGVRGVVGRGLVERIDEAGVGVRRLVDAQVRVRSERTRLLHVEARLVRAERLVRCARAAVDVDRRDAALRRLRSRQSDVVPELADGVGPVGGEGDDADRAPVAGSAGGGHRIEVVARREVGRLQRGVVQPLRGDAVSSADHVALLRRVARETEDGQDVRAPLGRDLRILRRAVHGDRPVAVAVAMAVIAVRADVRDHVVLLDDLEGVVVLARRPGRLDVEVVGHRMRVDAEPGQICLDGEHDRPRLAVRVGEPARGQEATRHAGQHPRLELALVPSTKDERHRLRRARIGRIERRVPGERGCAGSLRHAHVRRFRGRTGR